MYSNTQQKISGLATIPSNALGHAQQRLHGALSPIIGVMRLVANQTSSRFVVTVVTKYSAPLLIDTATSLYS